jgi:tetratricopeptide (TPR) repeat protein
MKPALASAIFLRATALTALWSIGCATAPQPVTKIVDGKVIVTRWVSPEAYEHVTRALLYEEEERWEEAATELQRALPFDDQAAEVRAHLAELFVRLGRLDDAAEQVERSLRIAPTVDGWLASAQVRQARGDQTGELEALRHAVAATEDPARPGQPTGDADVESAERARLALADAQIVALDIDGASETCRRLVQAVPNTLRGRIQYAALSWATGALGGAETALRGALEEEPSEVDARLLLAELQVADGHPAEAKLSFKDAIDRSDTPLEIAEGFVGWLVARGDRADALEIADRFASEGGDADALAAMSRIERAAKRPDRAKALAQKALKLGAPAGRVAILMGLAEADAGERSAAVASYLGVAADAPERLEAVLRAAELLRDDGKFDEAGRVLDGAKGLVGAAAVAADAPADKAKASPENDAEVQLAVAHSLIDEKKGDAALAARRLDEALAKLPDDARLLMARAAVEERRGDWRRALTFAESVLKDEERSVEALNFLGFVAADHGDDLPRAFKRLQAAAALNPGAGAIIDSLGWAYFRGGDLERATFFLEQAGRLEPGDAEILEHVGDLYAKRQERTRALATYRKALTLAPPDRLERELQERIRTLEAKSAAGR